MVRRPSRRVCSAAAMTSFISRMPLSTALKATNSESVRRAMSLARVVFAAPWRAPQNHRAQIIALDSQAQWLARTKQFLLAGELFEHARAHALSQRLRPR